MIPARLTLCETAELLLSLDDIALLCHRDPDGDTIGSAFALCFALRSRGKRASVFCSDAFPQKYGYITGNAAPCDFEPRVYVSVDVADRPLLGDYHDRPVALAIDHHPSNTLFAERTYLCAERGSCAEVVAEVIDALEVPFTPAIADALFTGVSTDTGCFRYSNVEAATHRLAARLIESGADSVSINQLMFESKSRARIAAEHMAIDSLEYFADGRIAVISLPLRLIEKRGVTDADLDGIAGIPRQIEGVDAGVTLRERPDGYRVSVRTSTAVDASIICQAFDGGGHRRAAGCTLQGSMEDVKARLIAEIGKQL